jgi:hypothetical protein
VPVRTSVIPFYVKFGYAKAKSSGSVSIRIHNTASDGTWIAQASMYRYYAELFRLLYQNLGLFALPPCVVKFVQRVPGNDVLYNL